MNRKILLALAACAWPIAGAQAAEELSGDRGTAALETAAGEDSASAAVDDRSTAPTDDGWQFAVTPYVWAAGMSGEVTLADGESADVDTGFDDILGDLKFAAMLGVEARNRRFVLLGDIIYLSLGLEADGPAGFVEAQVDPRMFIGTLVGGYRVVDQGPLFLDLVVGARLTALKIDVELEGPMHSIDRSRSKSSLAPVIGARFHAPLGGRWGFGAYGDVSGFGATADMTWQLMGTVQYELSDHWRLSVGYRHVDVSYDKNDFDIDLATSGPIIGFTYRFR